MKTAIIRHLALFPLLILPLSVFSAQTIRLGNTHAFLTSLIIVAEDQQFFEKAGVEVEVVPLKTGGDGLKGINAGSLQLYTASDVTFIKHFHSNDNLKVIATLGEWGNETKVIVRADSNIKTASDLKDKKIGVHKGLAFHWFLDLLLRRQGMTDADVELHYMHLAAQPKALLNGDIDAFVSREPFISEAKSLLPDNIQLIEAPNLMMKRFILIAGEKFLNEHTQEVTKVLEALLRAEQLIINDPDKLVEILARVFDKNLDEVKAQSSQMRFKLNLDNHLLYTLEKVAKWWQNIEGYEKPRDINFLDVIQTDALSKAKPHGVLMYR